MPEKSIIIIGAGIAGLSAGCYGQMNGYRTQIRAAALFMDGRLAINNCGLELVQSKAP